MSRHTRLAATKASPARKARAERNRMGRATARQDDLAVAQIRAARANYQPAAPKPKRQARAAARQQVPASRGPRDWAPQDGRFEAKSRPPSQVTAITTPLSWAATARKNIGRLQSAATFRRRGR